MNIQTANKLLNLRKKNNLSQEDLAEKLGISRQAISKWERAEASPDTENLIQLANLYRISLDELFDIDVKSFKSSKEFPTNETSRKTINLSKSKEDFEQTSNSKRVVYPKDSLKEEIYPNRDNSQTSYSTQQTSTKSVTNNNNQATIENNTFNPNRYIVPVAKNINSQCKQNSYSANTQSIFYTSSRLVDAFESFMAKNNITYKWLYGFPYYAIVLALFFTTGYFIGFDISWLWFLTIPLYYTTLKCMEKRNPMIFCYPIICLIIFYLQGMIFNGFLGFTTSWIWFLTIPLYYTIIPALKKKNPLIFCYPVLVVMAYLLVGFCLSWTLGLPLFATIPFYYWFFSKRV